MSEEAFLYNLILIIEESLEPTYLPSRIRKLLVMPKVPFSTRFTIKSIFTNLVEAAHPAVHRTHHLAAHVVAVRYILALDTPDHQDAVDPAVHKPPE